MLDILVRFYNESIKHLEVFLRNETEQPISEMKGKNDAYQYSASYDQEIEGYRTPKHNTFLHLINTEIISCENDKSDKKKKSSICRFQCG